MSNPTRAPAGTPTGGQFAPGQHSETRVTLDPASEESGQVDPAILDEMARRRMAVAEASQAYERACLLGQTFDVDKALSLRVTDEEIAQERVDRADATISDVVAKHVPGARSWSMESNEYDNGYFYDNQVAVYDDAADLITHLGSVDSRVSSEESAAMESAVAELNGVYEDENFHPHYHETEMP